MMKFLGLIIFMMLMNKFNNKVMFMFNMNFLLSFLMLFLFLNIEGVSFMGSYMIGLESYSLMLIILSVWIVSLMLMSLEISNKMKIFIFYLLLLILILFFSVSDLLGFYFMFEVSLIPTLWMIIYWGGNPERISSSYYLVMYMLLFSFPLLVYIFNMYMYSFSLKFVILEWFLEKYSLGLGGFVLIFGSMFIKLPMYLLHLWLPKAHVEAPVYGSMVLAGVLLKMGGYGLIRFMKLFVKSTNFYSSIFMSVGLIGSVFMGLVCLVQVDMKSLVAYSSIVHMNMMLCCLLTLSKMGMVGSVMMMVGHGLCSSALFYLVGLSYESSGSRLLLINKGLINKIPSLAIWWFLICVINFSFPLSLNFFGEILMLSVILNWDYFVMLFLMMICFFSSCYSLYLFSFTQHGGSMGWKLIYNLGLMKEFIVLIMHCYPLIFVLMNLMMFM
uniref:NADH-ubiquinone oxidoreductase chain 4 n=1 Tax=Cardiocondyla obscurior TaxID=286306 RepID=A0A343AXT1_9HYME|nr:NADH dehydrogenase subunit 4 [Cardiocondyla obscurior]